MSETPTLLRATLKAMHASGAGALVAPVTRGRGVIFTLHHVRPEPPPQFAPNRILTITPDFLEQVIVHVLSAGYDIVRLDDIPAILKSKDAARPFAAFTFDDGYRDNRDHALPVFEKYGLPFAIYIASELADGTGDLWWLALEEALRRLDSVTYGGGGNTAPYKLPASSVAEKDKAFEAVYWWLRGLPEAASRAYVQDLCKKAGFDPKPLAADLVMRWSELKVLACHPLVTLGAHTLGHWALAKLPLDEARRQVRDSVQRLETETGLPCRHFSYPYGDEGSAGPREFELLKEFGLSTAVTTRKSLIHAHHGALLTALPRLSLNGNFQDLASLEVLLTGAPFALLAAAQQMKSVVRGALRARSAAST